MPGRRAFALLAGALLLAGCGSSSGSSSSSSPTTGPATTGAATTAAASKAIKADGLTIAVIDPAKFLRASSVGLGKGKAPPIARAVRSAAALGKCTVRADPSGGRLHVHVPGPPTSGDDRPIWANWGFYERPIPYPYELQNLAHGGIVIHIGMLVTRVEGIPVIRMWAASPPYTVIEPGRPGDVSKHGVTVTSWQRALVCKTWTKYTLQAIIAFRNTYRGTGPDHVPSIDSGAAAPDLPTPALPDPTAQ